MPLVLIVVLLAATSMAQEGVLVIKAEPSDVEVYLDGELKASGTPAILKNLAEGTYTVTVRKEGYEDANLEVVVVEGVLSTEEVTLQVAGEESSLPAPGEVFKDCEACPEMVLIPLGDFYMGDLQGGGGSDELPVHEVTIAEPFAMSRHEITFDDYNRCVWDSACDGYPDDEGWGRGDRPVINVSWHEAKAFANWLSEKSGRSCRLPSEAEWEYACRAGTTTRYALPTPDGSDDIKGRTLANCGGCGTQWDNKRTAPAGSFPANALGLHDMHGNVWEWTEDCYQGSYHGAPEDGRAWQDTTGSNCERRVLRGGSWFHLQGFARCAFRYDAHPSRRSAVIGFRVVCSSPITNR